AFPKISTSSLSRLFSLRRRFSSSSSSDVRPVFSSASTSSIHRCNMLCATPSSRAICVAGLPLDLTRPTASRLNSFLNTRRRRFVMSHPILASDCLKEVSTENGQAQISAQRSRRGADTGDMNDFEHERLDMYRAAIEFLVLADMIAAALPRGRAYLADQLRR